MGNDKVDMVVIRVMGVVKISVASVEEGSLVFYIKSMDKAMNGGSFPPCHLNAVLVGICVNSRLWMYRNQWAYVDVRGGGMVYTPCRWPQRERSQLKLLARIVVYVGNWVVAS